MNKFHSFLLLCVTTFSLFGFTCSYAGNRAGALTVTLGGGYDIFASRREIQNAGYDIFASRREIQNAGVPFGILGYNLLDQWAFELLYGAFTADFENSVNDDREISGSLFLMDVVYRFSPIKPWCAVEPFLTAGVGVTGLNPNRNDAQNEGNMNIGLGAQFFANPNIAFRLDARDLYTRVGGKNDIFLDAGVSFLFDV